MSDVDELLSYTDGCVWDTDPGIPPAIPGFSDGQMRYLKGLSDRINELERRNDGVRHLYEKALADARSKGWALAEQVSNLHDQLDATQKAYKAITEELQASVKREERLRKSLERLVKEGVHA